MQLKHLNQSLSKNVSFFTFLFQLLNFLTNYFSEVLLELYVYILFRITHQTNDTYIVGLTLCIYIFSAGFCFDFFEAVNTTLGPLYSKKDYRMFTIKLFQMITLNLSFFNITII